MSNISITKWVSEYSVSSVINKIYMVRLFTGIGTLGFLSFLGTPGILEYLVNFEYSGRMDFMTTTLSNLEPRLPFTMSVSNPSKESQNMCARICFSEGSNNIQFSLIPFISNFNFFALYEKRITLTTGRCQKKHSSYLMLPQHKIIKKYEKRNTERNGRRRHEKLNSLFFHFAWSKKI